MKTYALIKKGENIVYTLVGVPENVECNLEEEIYDHIELQNDEFCMSGWTYDPNSNPRFFSPEN
jgi:hypothetical protein